VVKFAGGLFWHPEARDQPRGYERKMRTPGQKFAGTVVFALLIILMSPARALAQTPQPMPPGPPPDPARLLSHQSISPTRISVSSGIPPNALICGIS
jgi:hypothetical protein